MKYYRLYVDESGDHTYGKDIDNAAKKYLCLLGVIVDTDAYRVSFHPALEDLKQRHFPHSPDEPVILHRKDLINCRGPFGRLKDPKNEQRFNTDFLEFLQQQEYRLIGVTIDKKAHIERYGDAAYHPYHYCLAALLERYCGFLNLYNARGVVRAESRGATEDAQLKEAYLTLFRRGTYYRGIDFFQRALTSRQIKLKAKSANIAGLQLADLLAHPVKQEILRGRQCIPDTGDAFGKDICKVIARKYNCHIYQGTVEGYGKVFLG